MLLSSSRGTLASYHRYAQRSMKSTVFHYEACCFLATSCGGSLSSVTSFIFHIKHSNQQVCVKYKHVIIINERAMCLECSFGPFCVYWMQSFTEANR